MRMTLKIRLLLILTICLGLSACNINNPLAVQNSQGELLGNQLLIGKSFTLEAGNIIKGDIVGIGTDLTFKPGSLVEGDILLIGSSLEVGGIVKGDLNLFAGTSRILKSAILNGDINQFFHHVVLEHDSKVTGEMNSFTFPGFPTEQISKFISTAAEWISPNHWFLWDLSRTLVLSILALLAVILLKKPITIISSQIQSQTFISWGAGIIIAVAAPIIALILIITICLLPIGFLLLVVIALSYLLGWLALGNVIGKLIQQWLRIHWAEELQAFFGSLILGSITSVFGWIPCIGWVFNFTIGCIGLGAVIITRYGTKVLKGNLISDPIILIDEPPKKPDVKITAKNTKK
jgi:hypothetical protein